MTTLSIQNLSTSQNARLRIKKITGSVDIHTQSGAVSFIDPNLLACLSPYIPATFSCDGATQYAVFDVLPDTDYHVYIDDVLVTDANLNGTFRNIGVYPGGTAGASSAELMAAAQSYGFEAIGLLGPFTDPSSPLYSTTPAVIFMFTSATKHFKLVGAGIAINRRLEAGYLGMVGADPTALNPAIQVTGDTADFCMGVVVRPAEVTITSVTDAVFAIDTYNSIRITGTVKYSSDGIIAIKLTDGSNTVNTTYGGTLTGTWWKEVNISTLNAGTITITASTPGSDGITVVATTTYLKKPVAVISFLANTPYAPYYAPSLGIYLPSTQNRVVVVKIESVEDPSVFKTITGTLPTTGSVDLSALVGDLSDTFDFDHTLKATIVSIQNLTADVDYVYAPKTTTMIKPTLSNVNLSYGWNSGLSKYVAQVNVTTENIQNSRRISGLTILSDDNVTTYPVVLSDAIANDGAMYGGSAWVVLSDAQRIAIRDQINNVSFAKMVAKVQFTFGNGYVLEAIGDIPMVEFRLSITDETPDGTPLIEYTITMSEVGHSLQCADYNGNLVDTFPLVIGDNILTIDHSSSSIRSIALPDSGKITAVTANVRRGGAVLMARLGIGAEQYSFQNFGSITHIGQYSDYWLVDETDSSGNYYLPNSITTYRDLFKSPRKLYSNPTLTGFAFKTNANITDTSSMFEGCDLSSIDPSNILTNAVTNMSSMFKRATIRNWTWKDTIDTSNVDDMSSAFEKATFTGWGYNYPLALSLNTAKVTNMSRMFMNTNVCKYFNTHQFDVSQLRDASYMFAYFDYQGRTRADLADYPAFNNESWATLANGTDWTSFNPPLIENTEGMFIGCSTDLMPSTANWNMSNVYSIAYMYLGVKGVAVSMGNWVLSNLRNARAAFGNFLPNKYYAGMNFIDTETTNSMGDITLPINRTGSTPATYPITTTNWSAGKLVDASWMNYNNGNLSNQSNIVNPNLRYIDHTVNINSITYTDPYTPPYAMTFVTSTSGPGSLNVGIINQNRSDFQLNVGITTVLDDQFSGWTNAKFLYFSDGVQTIGARAFKGWSSLRQVRFPTGIRTIGEGAFIDNNKLAFIEFDEGVTSIGKDAFKNTALESLVLPATIQSIGEEAFSNIPSLRYLRCYATTPPTLSLDGLGVFDSGMRVQVPAAALDVYKAADGWKNFTITTIESYIP